jgi:hypothetical protein
MNYKLLLNEYDRKMITFHDLFYNLPFEIHNSKTDLDNTTITYNNDKNLKYNKYVLAYYYYKNDRIKFIWSWCDLNMNNNNNN